jgi:hypothetical protein
MERAHWRLRRLLFPPMARLFPLLLSLALLAPGLMAAPPAWASGAVPLQRDRYLCDDEPLVAELFAGAVDAPGIPNTVAGMVPGAYVVLHWQGLTLQLPRTNNAGAPSFTDGRWWWSAEDPDHPAFRQRRGGVQTYACAPLPWG